MMFFWVALGHYPYGGVLDTWNTLLGIQEVWHVDAVSVNGSRTKRTSGFAELVHFMHHMDSTQEMKLNKDPE